jgi:hypothetical protein
MRRTITAAVFALMVCRAADMPKEPTTIGIFYALTDGKLVDLERQSATIAGRTKLGGFGGAKVSSEFKPETSPVRLSPDGLSFVVRSFAAQTAVDPNTLYVLRVLKQHSHKRELLITDIRSPFALGGAVTTNLGEGVIAVNFEPFSEHSLRVTPVSRLGPGEYALSARLGALDVFCFGVDK